MLFLKNHAISDRSSFPRILLLYILQCAYLQKPIFALFRFAFGNTKLIVSAKVLFLSFADGITFEGKGPTRVKTDKTTKHLNQYRQLGLTIAYYRKLRGMTQLQLAEAVNLSRTHISTLEAPNMQTSLSLEKLFDIADALHVPVKNLFELRE